MHISLVLVQQTHQSRGGFPVDALQVDVLVLLLLPLLLLPFAAALDADAQTAEQDQQNAARKDGVNRPSRHCRRGGQCVVS